MSTGIWADMLYLEEKSFLVLNIDYSVSEKCCLLFGHACTGVCGGVCVYVGGQVGGEGKMFSYSPTQSLQGQLGTSAQLIMEEVLEGTFLRGLELAAVLLKSLDTNLDWIIQILGNTVMVSLNSGETK
jgi:hypothetical protein